MLKTIWRALFGAPCAHFTVNFPEDGGPAYCRNCKKNMERK